MSARPKRMTGRHRRGGAFRDRIARSLTYAEMSQQAAREGDVFTAVHAAWAADLCAAEAVIWQRVMTSSVRPETQFQAVARSVCDALAGPEDPSRQPPRDAATAVREVRRALNGALDHTTQSRLVDHLCSLSHLESVALPDAEATSRAAAARLDGRSAPEVSQLRVRTARDCAAIALALHRQLRDCDEARQLMWQSDWAAFEAYLLDSAVAAGDDALVGLELRWALARRATAALPTGPAQLVEASAATRAALASALDPTERDRLLERFAPLG